MRDNIILIGFMGTGKTTIGKQLAETIGYDFVDTDEYIEQMQNMKISDIFKKEGEVYFRCLETKVIRNMSFFAEKKVISTGGGLPLREENIDILKRLGFIVHLKTSPEETWNRIKYDNTRPLLQCENPYKKIEDLLKIRTPIYEKVGNITVYTDNISFEDIYNNIISEFYKIK